MHISSPSQDTPSRRGTAFTSSSPISQPHRRSPAPTVRRRRLGGLELVGHLVSSGPRSRHRRREVPQTIPVRLEPRPAVFRTVALHKGVACAASESTTMTTLDLPARQRACGHASPRGLRSAPTSRDQRQFGGSRDGPRASPAATCPRLADGNGAPGQARERPTLLPRRLRGRPSICRRQNATVGRREYLIE